MDKGEYIAPVENSPIDDFLREDAGSVEKYGVAFDRAATALRALLMNMSCEVGWKNTQVPFDFSGFSGFYPEIGTDCVDIYHGGKVVASFTSDADGRLQFEAYGPEFDYLGPEVNPWYPLADLTNGKFCMEKANIDLARREMHGGKTLVYGMRFGDACAFGINTDDVNLKGKLAERELNIRFVDFDSLGNAFDRWLQGNKSVGFMPENAPEVVIYLYDGVDVKSEREMSLVDDTADRQNWRRDLEMIDRLREMGEAVRTEVERAAGIPEGSPHFRFRSVLVPSTYLRGDALFLSSGYGLPNRDFLSVYNGKISLYRGYATDGLLSVPKRAFDSFEAAEQGVRKVCLSEENISAAKKEYQEYVESLSEKADKSKGIHP